MSNDDQTLSFNEFNKMGYDWAHGFWNKFNVFLKPEGKTKIYHYTNLDGLLGILESQCFWASNINFINDSGEFTYPISILSNTIGDLSSHLNGEKLLSFFQKSVDSFRRKQQITYCVSFCESNDLLSQWRGYSKGTAGFALGFNNEQFIMGIGGEDGILCFSNPKKVIYQPEIIYKIINEWITDVGNLYRTDRGKEMLDNKTSSNWIYGVKWTRLSRQIF